MRKFFSLALIGIASAALAGCSGGPAGSGDSPKPVGDQQLKPLPAPGSPNGGNPAPAPGKGGKGGAVAPGAGAGVQ